VSPYEMLLRRYKNKVIGRSSDISREVKQHRRRPALDFQEELKYSALRPLELRNRNTLQATRWSRNCTDTYYLLKAWVRQTDVRGRGATPSGSDSSSVRELGRRALVGDA
jgi:hypothetical protein